jgi:hypothetical protein
MATCDWSRGPWAGGQGSILNELSPEEQEDIGRTRREDREQLGSVTESKIRCFRRAQENCLRFCKLFTTLEISVPEVIDS